MQNLFSVLVDCDGPWWLTRLPLGGGKHQLPCSSMGLEGPLISGLGMEERSISSVLAEQEDLSFFSLRGGAFAVAFSLSCGRRFFYGGKVFLWDFFPSL